MKEDLHNPEFRLSQMVYKQLLRAYPKIHRDKYGAAMAQLFLDQSRDAWRESRNWGLFKLWMRTVPDLVSTSILERIAALKKRRTMSEKISRLATIGTTPKITFVAVFTTVFLITLTLGTAVTFILPESYASTARIKVEPDAPASSGPVAGYDPYFIQTTFEIIQSEVVLRPAVDKLNLNTLWGKKYFNGETLKTAESIQILKQRLQLAPVKNTKLIGITVYSDDKIEAAQVANAIATSYQDFRNASYKGPTPEAHPALVQIIDPAVPGQAPVRPNKPLNIMISAVLGILAGMVIGIISALISMQFGRARLRNLTTM